MIIMMIMIMIVIMIMMFQRIQILVSACPTFSYQLDWEFIFMVVTLDTPISV